MGTGSAIQGGACLKSQQNALQKPPTLRNNCITTFDEIVNTEKERERGVGRRRGRGTAGERETESEGETEKGRGRERKRERQREKAKQTQKETEKKTDMTSTDIYPQGPLKSLKYSAK